MVNWETPGDSHSDQPLGSFWSFVCGLLFLALIIVILWRIAGANVCEARCTELEQTCRWTILKGCERRVADNWVDINL